MRLHTGPMQQLLARDDVRYKRRIQNKRWGLDPKTSVDISWIFVRRGAELQVLKKRTLGQHVRIKKRRLKRRFALECEKQSNSLGAQWLFLRQGADVRAMKEYLTGDSLRTARVDNARWIANNMKLLDCMGDLNTIWLFLPVDTGIGILQEQNHAMRRRAMRAKVKDDGISFSDTDDLIMGGAWIFQNTTPAASYTHLLGLFKILAEEY